MSRKLVGLVVAGMFIAGCGQTPRPQQVPAVGSATSATSPSSGSPGSFRVDEFVVGEPIRFENLTIFPVTSRDPKTEDRYVTLDEGLKAGTVEIRELAATYERPVHTAETATGEPASALASINSDDAVAATNDESPVVDQIQYVAGNTIGNEVNTLIVVNNSDKPLYLMPGEIIIGGSQDRAIANELVVAPHSSPTRIPVYCVEHGRWGAKGADETLAQIESAAPLQLIAHAGAASLGTARTQNQLAEDADRGKFVATIGQLGKASRVAVQSDKDQSAVWDSVAKTNSQSGVNPDSGAFTANYVDLDNIKKLEPYIEHMQTRVLEAEHVVGVLVAINGKIESIDVFDSSPLFRKVWPKLLKSYALDATNAEELREVVAINRDAAEAFLGEALQAKVSSLETEHGVALTRREGQRVLSFSSHVEPAASPAAMGGIGGGMGGAVHFSGYAK